MNMLLAELSFTQSTGLWCLVFALIGAHMYAIDKKFGIKIYGKLHKWTSPRQQTKEFAARGFVYNRSNKVRWFWATVIASFNFAVMIGWRHGDPRVELLQFFLIVPATMLGFMIGPLYVKAKHRREQLFETLDKVESDEIDVTEELKKATDRHLKKANSLLDRILVFFSSLFPNKKNSATTKNPIPPAPVAPEPTLKEARAALRKFGTQGKESDPTK